MEFVHIELYNPKGSRNIDTKKKKSTGMVQHY